VAVLAYFDLDLAPIRAADLPARHKVGERRQLLLTEDMDLSGAATVSWGGRNVEFRDRLPVGTNRKPPAYAHKFHLPAAGRGGVEPASAASASTTPLATMVSPGLEERR
jgi:hypothetical protein